MALEICVHYIKAFTQISDKGLRQFRESGYQQEAGFNQFAFVRRNVFYEFLVLIPENAYRASGCRHTIF